MGRTHIAPIQQPDDTTCGPSALKIALHVIGIKRSFSTLKRLCKTTRNGTTTKNLIGAINALGLPVLVVEYANLKHLQRALKYQPSKPRAVMVSYLYDLDEKNQPHPDSGHWATVSTYLASKSRIVILDSATAKHKSYDWNDFRLRWKDYDWKRKRVKSGGNHFQLVRHWQPQLMLVIAKDASYLPKFTIASQKVFIPEA